MSEQGASRSSVFQNILGEVRASSSQKEPVTMVAIEKIKGSPVQPRRHFDGRAMDELVDSVRRYGLLQPLLLRPVEVEEYELVAGERRLRAARQAGFEEVPAIVREMSGEEAACFALVENLQRQDLNPLEETEGMLELVGLSLGKTAREVEKILYAMDDDVRRSGATHNVMGSRDAEVVSEVFKGVGAMSWQSFVKNRLPLLRLPEDVVEAIRERGLAYSKARIIARVPDSGRRSALLERVLEEGVSVGELRLQVGELIGSGNEAELDQIRSRARSVSKLLGKKGSVKDKATARRVDELLAELESLLGQ